MTQIIIDDPILKSFGGDNTIKGIWNDLYSKHFTQLDVTFNIFDLKSSIPNDRQILNKFDAKILNSIVGQPKSNQEMLEYVGEKIVLWYLKTYEKSTLLRSRYISSQTTKGIYLNIPISDMNPFCFVDDVYFVIPPFTDQNKTYSGYILGSKLQKHDRLQEKIENNDRVFLHIKDFYPVYEISIREHIEMLFRFSPIEVLNDFSDKSTLFPTEHILNRTYSGYCNSVKHNIEELIYA